MKTIQIIDLAIDRGATRLCLSPKQFSLIKRKLKVINGKPTYRGAAITRWNGPAT